ncbi:diguanylate cyclase [Rubrobacter calidifluminis]|uniref:GGDEF domain-containing response regulator n=1 Tax=Rubrobacter calidifluminis TaxID=1392640 RepID=UPI0023625FA8|nr:diguanylate cyclase [Rubrobacter calidifluminis]
MKILVAEDDPVSRTILVRAVEKLGHECVAASDGEEAWEKYRKTPDLDVIISDWMMPGMDGAELCRRVRDDGREDYVHFIFLTALSDREHLLEGLEAGADDYLTKPLDRAELQVRLKSAARIRELYRNLEQKNAELEQLKDEFFRQARRDSLTGLGNRRRLEEDLELLQGQAERYGYSYCVALCDVDFFKSYNDHYGHPRGDRVLKTVARVLRESCRRGDAVYRYGGEEFLVVLPGQSLKSAALAAERMRAAVEGLAIPHEAREAPRVVTISAGVAPLPVGRRADVEEVLGAADSALYAAKRSGRNRVCVHGRGRDA